MQYNFLLLHGTRLPSKSEPGAVCVFIEGIDSGKVLLKKKTVLTQESTLCYICIHHTPHHSFFLDTTVNGKATVRNYNVCMAIRL